MTNKPSPGVIAGVQHRLTGTPLRVDQPDLFNRSFTLDEIFNGTVTITACGDSKPALLDPALTNDSATVEGAGSSCANGGPPSNTPGGGSPSRGRNI
jgi:hypothetical protein